MVHVRMSDLRAWARRFLVRRAAEVPGCTPSPDRDQTKRHSIELVILEAQSRVASLGLVSIDRDERRVRTHPMGLEVRAWYLLPERTLPDHRIAHPGWLAALHAMPPLTRTILAMNQMDGMDGADIARTLGISRRSVRSHLRKAVRLVAQSCS